MIAHDMKSGNKIKGVERWRGVKASQDKKYFGTFVKTMLDKVDQNYIGPKHL